MILVCDPFTPIESPIFTSTLRKSTCLYNSLSVHTVKVMKRNPKLQKKKSNPSIRSQASAPDQSWHMRRMCSPGGPSSDREHTKHTKHCKHHRHQSRTVVQQSQLMAWSSGQARLLRSCHALFRTTASAMSCRPDPFRRIGGHWLHNSSGRQQLLRWHWPHAKSACNLACCALVLRSQLDCLLWWWWWRVEERACTNSPLYH